MIDWDRVRGIGVCGSQLPFLLRLWLHSPRSELMISSNLIHFGLTPQNKGIRIMERGVKRKYLHGRDTKENRIQTVSGFGWYSHSRLIGSCNYDNVKIFTCSMCLYVHVFVSLLFNGRKLRYTPISVNFNWWTFF